MAFLALSGADVEHLLSPRACIDVMAEALIAVEQGDMIQPVRSTFRPPDGAGTLAWMPARRHGAAPVFGMKILCIVPSNTAKGLHAHQGAVILLDGATGEVRALVDAAAITAIRTAAVSALATRLLAREDASDLAIIGTGVQAERHLEALCLVRPITRARVAGRTPDRAHAFVERVRPHLPFPLEASPSAESAVEGADIVVTATSAAEPVLHGAWVAPGAHVNAIGASNPSRRELDSALLTRAALFTDRRESLEAEAGEYRLALQEGAIRPEHVRGELGQVLTQKVPGRSSPEEITLFRSLGLASEDVAAAQYVLHAALQGGSGTLVPF